MSDPHVVAAWTWKKGEWRRALVRSLLFQKNMIIVAALCFSLLLATAAVLQPGTYLLFCLAIPLLVVAAIVAMTTTLATLMLKKVPGLRGQLQLSMAINDEGMQLTVEQRGAMRTWDRFRVLKESRNFYFAQPNDRPGFVPLFPKRALRTPTDEQAFRLLVDEHTKSSL